MKTFEVDEVVVFWRYRCSVSWSWFFQASKACFLEWLLESAVVLANWTRNFLANLWRRLKINFLNRAYRKWFDDLGILFCNKLCRYLTYLLGETRNSFVSIALRWTLSENCSQVWMKFDSDLHEIWMYVFLNVSEECSSVEDVENLINLCHNYFVFDR